jgi:hypothetical protein
LKVKNIIMSSQVGTKGREGGRGMIKLFGRTDTCPLWIGRGRARSGHNIIKWNVPPAVSLDTTYLAIYNPICSPSPSLISRAWKKVREKTSSRLTPHHINHRPPLFPPHRCPGEILGVPRGAAGSAQSDPRSASPRVQIHLRCTVESVAPTWTTSLDA